MEFSPNSIHKFDTHIQVNVRGWKTISLRVGGTIEPPCVDIDVVSTDGLLTTDRASQVLNVRQDTFNVKFQMIPYKIP